MSDIPTLKPAMTPKEIDCLEKHLAKASSYLEFGCGGSTLLAVRSPARRIWSVESDPAWIELVRRHPEIAAAEADGRLTLWHADIGRTRGYGYPATPLWQRIFRSGLRAKWPNYYETIWTQEGAADADLFLVDGRFRVASGLAIAARCRDNALVAVHDFSAKRDYATLLDVYKKVDRARNLMVLQRQSAVTQEQIAGLMRDFSHRAD